MKVLQKGRSASTADCGEKKTENNNKNTRGKGEFIYISFTSMDLFYQMLNAKSHSFTWEIAHN